MREKLLFAGWIGCFCLLFFIGIVSSEYTARYCIGQYQAVVGNLYKESPKAAKKLLYTTFSGKKDKKAKQIGIKAAKEAGFTEEAFVFCYHQLFPNPVWFAFLGTAFLTTCFFGMLVWKYRMEEMQRAVRLKKRLLEYEKGAAFSAAKKTGKVWLSLEYYLWKLIDAKKRQQEYFMKRQEQMRFLF